MWTSQKQNLVNYSKILFFFFSFFFYTILIIIIIYLFFFRTLTSDDILETYQVTNPLTRKQLQHVITQLKAEEDTDTEVRN